MLSFGWRRDRDVDPKSLDSEHFGMMGNPEVCSQEGPRVAAERRAATAYPSISCFEGNLLFCFGLPVEFFLGYYGSLSESPLGPRGCAKHRSSSRYHWCERH